MSRNQRIGLIVAALVVGIVAFAVASPGGDDDGEQAAQTTPTQTQTETAPEETEAEPAPPPEPAVTRISVEGGQVVGGAKRIEAGSGETVRIVVSSDAPDELHLHGYDITMNSAPGQPARFQFKANLEGVFELESHVAEDAGRDPLVAQVVVQPS
jgi:hypothetical protein